MKADLLCNWEQQLHVFCENAKLKWWKIRTCGERWIWYDVVILDLQNARLTENGNEKYCHS